MLKCCIGNMFDARLSVKKEVELKGKKEGLDP